MVDTGILNHLEPPIAIYLELLIYGHNYMMHLMDCCDFYCQCSFGDETMTFHCILQQKYWIVHLCNTLHRKYLSLCTETSLLTVTVVTYV